MMDFLQTFQYLPSWQRSPTSRREDDIVKVRYDAKAMRWIANRPAKITYPTARQLIREYRKEYKDFIPAFYVDAQLLEYHHLSRSPEVTCLQLVGCHYLDLMPAQVVTSLRLGFIFFLLK